MPGIFFLSAKGAPDIPPTSPTLLPSGGRPHLALGLVLPPGDVLLQILWVQIVQEFAKRSLL